MHIRPEFQARPAYAALLLVALLMAIPPAAAQDQGPVAVDVTLAVINFGNYDAKQGTYVLDFYMVLKWDTKSAPANFTPERFEFANGRATSRELQGDTTDAEGVRSLFFRVQANLYSTPQYDAYPFDHQTIEIALEDTENDLAHLVYVPNPASGLEGTFEPAGWQLRGTTFNVTRHEYSFDEPYSQARMVIEIQRSVLSGVLKVLLPPIAFVIISGISFILLGADKVATRFALSANMAISGIMFHAAQSASLPSLSSMIFLDRYMLSVHTFTFGSVLVTALVAIAEMKWKAPLRARGMNWRGAVIVVLATVGVFALLQLV